MSLTINFRSIVLTHAALFALAMATAGCGDPNSRVSFNTDTGAHTAAWVYSHRDPAVSDPEECTRCHGPDLSGGISHTACATCHLKGSPYVLTGCTSCHEKPPAGSTPPDRAGAHAAHNALPPVTNVCNTCHNGAGSGTPGHYDGVVEVAFLPNYNSKSGPATVTYDPVNNTYRCFNISCHGGPRTQSTSTFDVTETSWPSTTTQTQDWLTGTMTVYNFYTDCLQCHIYGTTEYNSYSSGKHYLHFFEQSVICTLCHDTTKLAAVHFTNIDNPVISEEVASSTIQDYCNFNGITCQSTLCHSGLTRTW